MINDKNTRAIADIYSKMLESSKEKTVVTGEDEDGNETTTSVDNPVKAKQVARRLKTKRHKNVQVATIQQEAAMDGTKHLSGEGLVNALTSACLSSWYDLVNKFNSRPEVYDIHAESGSNADFKVFKMTPGADVRETAFDNILKSTNSIASALNKLFGKDVFEPRVSRTNGKLETLVAYSKTKGGVFQCKASEAGGHTEITLTMPEEKELKRAFSSMTDTPHADNMGELGFDDPEDVPVAGDPVPDYNADYDVEGDLDTDFDDDPLNAPDMDDEEELDVEPYDVAPKRVARESTEVKEMFGRKKSDINLGDLVNIWNEMWDEDLTSSEEELMQHLSSALNLDAGSIALMSGTKVGYKWFRDSVNQWFTTEIEDGGESRRKILELLIRLSYPVYGQWAQRMWSNSNGKEGLGESSGVPVTAPCNLTIKNYETGKTVTLVLRENVSRPSRRRAGIYLVGPSSSLGNGISVSEFIDKTEGDTVRHANGQMSQILNVTHMSVTEKKCDDDKEPHATITNKRSGRVTKVVKDKKTGKQEVKNEAVDNPLDAAKKIADVGAMIRNTQIHGKGKPGKKDEKRRKERDSLRKKVDEGRFEFLDKAGKALGIISGARKEAIAQAKEKWGDKIQNWRDAKVDEEVSVGGSIAAGDSTANPEKLATAGAKKKPVRRKKKTNESSDGAPYGFGTSFSDDALRKQAIANRKRNKANRPPPAPEEDVADQWSAAGDNRNLYSVTSLSGWYDLEAILNKAFGDSYPDSEPHDKVIDAINQKSWTNLEDFEIVDLVNAELEKKGEGDMNQYFETMWDDVDADREEPSVNPFKTMESKGWSGGPFG